MLQEKEKINFQEDIDNIGKIPIVPNLLDVVCRLTGMGFAAIARVTETNWIACSVRDDISFGLKPGGELQVKTTICNEIRDSGKAVVIDHVKEDPHFRDHHTPAMYGFQSYISVPIFRKDKSFFGTLCAIDPHPRKLNTPEVIGTFNLFAELISFHLDAIEQLTSSKLDLEWQLDFTTQLEEKISERTAQLEEKNEILVQKNKELQEFNYISSHDLQEPLRKIQTFVSRIQSAESSYLTDAGSVYFHKIREAAERMQSLINDLLSYSQTERTFRKFEYVDLRDIVKEVVEDFREEIEHKSATIEVKEMCSATVIPFQVRQLFYNIIGNSLKYASKERRPKIEVSAAMIAGKELMPDPPEDARYCHIKIFDNGIGFRQEYSEKIFELFKRLHNGVEYSGTGVGLAIVKKIVENHNGSIIAKGIEDVGAEFNIYIPEILYIQMQGDKYM